jgi:hypothetical protein
MPVDCRLHTCLGTTVPPHLERVSMKRGRRDVEDVDVDVEVEAEEKDPISRVLHRKPRHRAFYQQYQRMKGILQTLPPLPTLYSLLHTEPTVDTQGRSLSDADIMSLVGMDRDSIRAHVEVCRYCKHPARYEVNGMGGDENPIAFVTCRNSLCQKTYQFTMR